MPTEVKAQNTTTLASVKAIYDAAEEANGILDAMNAAATAAHTTLTGIYADAEQAAQDASDAKTAAGTAQTAADSALVSLATAQDVVGVLNWITAHGTMTNTQDLVPPETVIDPSHVYFVQDDVTPGDYHVGAHYYAIVSEPKQADIASYYLLTVDESVQNYVATHIVVDTEGLWIVPDAGGNKVLIATGSGSTYTTAGTYIIGKVGGVDTVLAKFTASGAQVGENASGKSRTEVSPNGMEIIRNDEGSDVKIATLGYGSGNSSSDGTSNKPYYTFGQRKKASSEYDSSATYYKGDLCLHDGIEYVCKYDNITGAWRSTLWQLSHGNWSIAEGYNIVASGTDSHAEGWETEAIGKYSHSEGEHTLSAGIATHTEGILTYANGNGAHAEGTGTRAEGDYSHTGGSGTRTLCKSQTVIGEYNELDPDWDAVYKRGRYAAIVGNGTADNARSNALTVDWSGNVNIASGAKYKINGTALAASDVGAMPVMAGVIQMYAGSTAPTGWLICDGSEKLISDYPTLHSVIGNTYNDPNNPSDADHFRLPDFRGRMPIGVGESTADGHTAHTLAEADGKEAYKLTAAQSGMRDHTHNYYDANTTYTFPTGKRATTSSSCLVSATTHDSSTTRTSNGVNSIAGASATTDHTNMPPYLGINFIIATGKTD